MALEITLEKSVFMYLLARFWHFEIFALARRVFALEFFFTNPNL